MEQAIEKSLNISPKQANELKLELGVSQPTISRAVSHLEKQKRILRVGKARATRYAAVRRLPQLPDAELPVYEIDAKGDASRVATLTPVQPNRFAIIPEAPLHAAFPIKADIYSSLPYYLQGLRPEGFIGRLTAGRVSTILRLPADLLQWSEDDVLIHAALFGKDLPGAFVVGEEAIARFLEAEPAPNTGPEEKLFPSIAKQIESGEQVGSSAGGEQPKFTVYSDGKKPCHSIVKFSSDAENTAAERWRDLLVCEYIALETLRTFGFKASPVRLVTGENRMFLVVERFDRIGKKGRRHYFSFGALDDALHGDRRDVRKSARFFYENDFISDADYATLISVSLFGDLIGNNDQHFGNTSFTAEGKTFSMAPAYDVLPMWYAPRSQGSIVTGLHTSKPILPEFNAYKKTVREMAEHFWSHVSKERLISAGFRAIAQQNLGRFATT